MEFVVISGGTEAQAREAANRLRAHGYHYFSPDQFFMDDFGDLHPNAASQKEATEWVEKHAIDEVKHHHDVVTHGVLMNPTLMAKAKEEGYHVSVIHMDVGCDAGCQDQIEQLIEQHEREHPSLFQRMFGKVKTA
jgi:hypothetical protein